jgi:hypothetical protein
MLSSKDKRYWRKLLLSKQALNDTDAVNHQLMKDRSAATLVLLDSILLVEKRVALVLF